MTSGATTSETLVATALKKAKDYCSLNAFTSLEHEKACDYAAMVQREIEQKTAHWLSGIPVAVKDIFCVENSKTTCGSHMLSDFIAPYESCVSERLKDAGLIIIGKTNMDEFAMGSSGENSYFGKTYNPWDKTRVPGGSSSGSACAVAAGIVPVAIGTDTGGSVRQPAAFCGISGIKPTYGRISRYGMVAFASSLDQAGVFAKSAEDLAHILTVIAGHDSRDSTSLETDDEDFSKFLKDPIAGRTIGVIEECLQYGIDDEIIKLTESALKNLEKSGAIIKKISLPSLQYATPAYYVLASAEASSNLARYDGVRYKYRSENYHNLEDMYEQTRAEGFGTEVKRRILVGTYVLSYGYYDAYYKKAQKIRHLIAADFEKAFEECDALVTPTTPTTAFKFQKLDEDPVKMYLNDIYTVPANLAGLPAVSIPCGFDHNGLPAGLQFIGPSMQDARILNMAHQYQQETDWHLRRPPNYSE